MDRKKEKESLGKAIAYENFEAEAAEEEAEEVVRSKSILLKPMSIDEAITRMEALDHDFFLYLDEEDDRIGVVYRRVDGGYGVLEAENKLK
jgi:putative sigma-54 modulation protein